MRDDVGTGVTLVATRWAPLLHGGARDQAGAAVAQIIEALGVDHLALPDASLARGHAGVALALGYLAPDDPAAAAAHFARALDAIATGPTPASLHGGFVGVGWVGAHLGLIAPDDDGLDEGVAAAVAAPAAVGQLMTGLAGVLVYVRERPRSLSIAAIIDALEACRDRWGRGLLGVAHGMAGIAAAVGHADTGARGAALARDAIVRVLARRDELIGTPVFGWCHSDIGVAAALLGIAARLDDDALAATALELAHGAARRHRDDGVVRDASVCHGAAGLGHLFNRIYQATGDARCEDAARCWFQRALRQRGADGVGGYRAWLAPERAEHRWCDEAGLLHGSAGVALALHAAISARPPAWDRSFGLG